MLKDLGVIEALVLGVALVLSQSRLSYNSVNVFNDVVYNFHSGNYGD